MGRDRVAALLPDWNTIGSVGPPVNAGACQPKGVMVDYDPEGRMPLMPWNRGFRAAAGVIALAAATSVHAPAWAAKPSKLFPQFEAQKGQLGPIAVVGDLVMV